MMTFTAVCRLSACPSSRILSVPFPPDAVRGIAFSVVAVVIRNAADTNPCLSHAARISSVSRTNQPPPPPPDLQVTSSPSSLHLSSSTAGKSMLTMDYFNAQSQRQMADEVCEFVVDNDLEVLMVNETWLLVAGDEPCLRELTPTDYVTYAFPRS